MRLTPSKAEKSLNDKIYSAKTLHNLILTLENENDFDSLVIHTNERVFYEKDAKNRLKNNTRSKRAYNSKKLLGVLRFRK